MMAINIHAYPSTFKHETRILKETESLAQASIFDKIIITALWDPGLEQNESLDHSRAVWRIALWTRKLPKQAPFRALRLIEWMLRILLHFRRSDVAVVSCHCLAVLPLGLAFKVFKRAKIVYETHELETERHGWSTLKKRIARITERLLIKSVDRVVVVGPSIKLWYETNYSLNNVYLVRAIPRITIQQDAGRKRDLLRKTFGINADALLFLYHGVLNTGRSIQTLLTIFSELPLTHHLVIMGYGPLEGEVREFASKYKNIHLHPAVPPYDVVHYCCSADIGFSLFEPSSLSYMYSCPNKLFEYILSGVPAIVSDFPDMGGLVDEFDCGWRVKIDKDAIRKLISGLSRADIAAKTLGTSRAMACLSWESEAQELLRAYETLMGKTNIEQIAVERQTDSTASVINEL